MQSFNQTKFKEWVVKTFEEQKKKFPEAFEKILSLVEKLIIPECPKEFHDTEYKMIIDYLKKNNFMGFDLKTFKEWFAKTFAEQIAKFPECYKKIINSIEKKIVPERPQELNDEEYKNIVNYLEQNNFMVFDQSKFEDWLKNTFKKSKSALENILNLVKKDIIPLKELEWNSGEIRKIQEYLEENYFMKENEKKLKKSDEKIKRHCSLLSEKDIESLRLYNNEKDLEDALQKIGVTSIQSRFIKPEIYSRRLSQTSFNEYKNTKNPNTENLLIMDPIKMEENLKNFEQTLEKEGFFIEKAIADPYSYEFPLDQKIKNCVERFKVYIEKTFNNYNISELLKKIDEKIESYLNLSKNIEKINQNLNELLNTFEESMNQSINDFFISDQFPNIDLGKFEALSKNNQENIKKKADLFLKDQSEASQKLKTNFLEKLSIELTTKANKLKQKLIAYENFKNSISEIFSNMEKRCIMINNNENITLEQLKHEIDNFYQKCDSIIVEIPNSAWENIYLKKITEKNDKMFKIFEINRKNVNILVSLKQDFIKEIKNLLSLNSENFDPQIPYEQQYSKIIEEYEKKASVIENQNNSQLNEYGLLNYNKLKKIFNKDIQDLNDLKATKLCLISRKNEENLMSLRDAQYPKIEIILKQIFEERKKKLLEKLASNTLTNNSYKNLILETIKEAHIELEQKVKEIISDIVWLEELKVLLAEKINFSVFLSKVDPSRNFFIFGKRNHRNYHTFFSQNFEVLLNLNLI